MAQREDDPNIKAKIKELAEMIASGVAEQMPELLAARRFTCDDYACTGQNFRCSSFRCPGSFKVESASQVVDA